MTEPRVLIDIQELSRRLSVPQNSLYQKVYRRNIPFIKIGRSLRFDYDEVLLSFRHSHAPLQSDAPEGGA
jgi:excisionase family DNA binding protein